MTRSNAAEVIDSAYDDLTATLQMEVKDRSFFKDFNLIKLHKYQLDKDGTLQRVSSELVGFIEIVDGVEKRVNL